MPEHVPRPAVYNDITVAVTVYTGQVNTLEQNEAVSFGANLLVVPQCTTSARRGSGVCAGGETSKWTGTRNCTACGEWTQGVLLPRNSIW